MGSGNDTAVTVDSDGNVGISTDAPNARFEIEDAGTSQAVLQKITADNANVYGLVIGNDTYSTSDIDGLRMFTNNSGLARIQAVGTSSQLVLGAVGGDDITINSSGGVEFANNVGFFATTPVAQATALTASNASTVDGTYGTEEQNVINNLRTRLDELEDKLQAYGLLA